MTSHLHVQLIADYLHKRGVRHVVICPGSRSAPFVIALNEYPAIKKYVIADERSAAYFALGIAQQIHFAVAVICTSGTAALNLVPAIAEASAQALPLIAITADRPEEMHWRGENQTIEQKNIFIDYIPEKSAINFKPLRMLKDFTDKLLEMDETLMIVHDEPSFPAHWNVEIPEPLYERAGEEIPPYNLSDSEADLDLIHQILGGNEDLLLEEWENAERILIICGYAQFTPQVIQQLKHLSENQNIVIVSEHASNLPFQQNETWNLDALLTQMKPDSEKNYAPDLVITLGRHILSKKLKQLIKKNKPRWHFHVSSHGEAWDQFYLEDKFDFFKTGNSLFLSKLTNAKLAREEFKQAWINLRTQTQQHTQSFLSKAPFSDLKVYESIYSQLPSGTNLQLGNSTPVRYAQFFNLPENTKVNANRGTSGIDGCLSTAVGAALTHHSLTVCIIGDISFFYDSNALWNKYLSPNLRIILINNGGGNIFRLLSGPETVKGFEDYFEAQHNLSAKYLAEMYGLQYYFCESQGELNTQLPDFFQPKNKAAILEVKTDNEISATVYKQYFSHLKNHA
ncbi:MAG: 2-succinyl-5-enolpyruvyl-6-hydroxy-3-cyclohexene-1-carboxylic-acid synthase [Chitinophagales bacterium]|nr:2-succinyl-5-enolpyruvyl-6-hydroxy-3-cyclohexene-1-carboxylic-acid synthase [Chitinophagales bacterium]MCO5280088.1 2-succinyl-5-enolpyruvyl-6-hydroxy-3-cyclohexene-1-carboxylic-acid synthase [Chitinophagales bacterium]OJV27241.1 MAG: 2-succinyl-5-enolpyruvyl-6-hydroxy-3-cyclohexene-1-carboxylic-acid synthase [Bacteroidetes bacterium 37-13]